MAKEKIKKLFPILIIFILSVLLAYTFPLTGDDYGKGAAWIIESFKSAYDLWQTYNGRFFGNMLVFMLNYSKFFRVILEASVMTGIIYFISKNTYNKNKTNSIILSFILFFGMSIKMFRESISWMSGFANFAIPALMFAILIYNFKNIFEEKEVKYKWYQYIIAILCGVFTNLFSEHTSIFSVLIGIGFIIASLINHKKVYKIQMLYLLISIIFCGLMFLSPVYWGEMPRLSGADYYTSLNIFQKVYYNLRTSSWIENMVFDNVILNIIISFIFLKTFKSNNKILKSLNILLVILCVFVFPLISYNAKLFNLEILYSKKIQFLLMIIYFITIIILIIKNFNFKKSLQLISYFLGAFIAATPLLLAYGIGPRCFLTSYVLLMIFTLVLASELEVYNKLNRLIFSLISISLIAIFTVVYISNYKIFQERNKILADVDKDQLFISLPLYEYPSFIHQGGTPGYGGYHYKVYLLYYGLSPDTYIDFYETQKKTLYRGFITIPTYDGSNQATHPSVMALNNKSFEYKYYMAMTPWPNNNNKYENPSILASNDGIKWEEPKGINNPVSGIPTLNSNDYYSDPYLYKEDDTLNLIYRYNPYNYKGNISNVDNNLILEKTSKNGIDWSEEKIIFDKKEGHAYMSPSRTKKDDHERLYYVNYDNNIYYKEKNKNNWKEQEQIYVNGLKNKIWHAELKIINDVYIMIAYADNKLYLASSLDGINFENARELNIKELPTSETTKTEEYTRVYKSSILISNDIVSFYIPYNVKTKELSTWGIYLYQDVIENYKWLFEVA